MVARPAGSKVSAQAEKICQRVMLPRAAITKGRHSARGTLRLKPASLPIASSPIPPVSGQMLRKAQIGTSATEVLMVTKFKPQKIVMPASSHGPLRSCGALTRLNSQAGPFFAPGKEIEDFLAFVGRRDDPVADLIDRAQTPHAVSGHR